MKNKLFWSFYDMGNSAHALIITTIAFPLYFKQYLFSNSTNVESIWAIITAAILAISAFLAPWLTARAYSQQCRAKYLLICSLCCIIPTFLLGISGINRIAILLFYIISCIGYYVSLPLYNSFLPNIEQNTYHMQVVSSNAWGLGYLGGIIVAIVCFSLGLFNYSPSEESNLFSRNFFVAAVFLTIFCLPLLTSTFKIEKSLYSNSSKSSSFISVFESIKQRPNILKLLLIYWLIGEVATVGIYFFSMYMIEFGNLDSKDILFASLVIQCIGIFSTMAAGRFAEKIGVKRAIFIIVSVWILVPILLFAISKGLNYWIPVTVIGLIVGSYHSIIRAEIAKKVQNIDDSGDKGSIWGFFDTTGRFSQILCPILVAILLNFMPLNYAILCTIVFPICALILLNRYNENE